MAEFYRHTGNRKEYELLGTGRFLDDATDASNDTLSILGQGLYSEDITSKITIYRQNGHLVLQHVEGPDNLDKSIDYAIYQAQYDCDLGNRIIWVRPKSMFFGERHLEGRLVKRFERIDKN